MRRRWHQLTPATTPSVRYGQRMCFDQANDELVMHGGSTGAPTDETWTWDRSALDWVQESPATSPGGILECGFCFDETNGNVVRFGGVSSLSPFTRSATTRTWNGTNWTNLTPATSPTARQWPAMAYDGTNGYVLLFGGSLTGSPAYSNQTWKWTGTNWVQLTPATTPSARFSHAMGYDPVGGYVLMYGGLNAGPAITDLTLKWDGTQDWTVLSPATSPTPVIQMMMDWDPVSQRLLMYGGADGATDSNEVWAWNRSGNWELVAICGTEEPIPHQNLAWASDRTAGLMYAFGGDIFNPVPTASNDTWQFGAKCNRPQVIRWH